MKTSIRNKKGFTIVELVIVIAVIAILAAVLIPTFANLVEKANLSADEQAVKQMNTALKIYEAENGKPEGISTVKIALGESGINANIEPVSDGYAFYWDSGDNVIELVASGETVESDWVLIASNGYGKTVANVTDANGIATALNGESPILIKLENDISVDQAISIGENSNSSDIKVVILDLNGKKLTASAVGNSAAFTVRNGSQLIVKNGSVETSSKWLFFNNGSNLTIDSVTINSTNSADDGSVVFVNKFSDTNILNSTITCTNGYGIGTNSSENEDDGSRILVSDTTITNNGNYSGILVTIYADVTINDCVINGGYTGVTLRGCNATIKDTKITHTKSEDGSWGQGCSGKCADIVFACGGTGFTGYATIGNYKCTNVTASTVIVHEPVGGKVTVSGIDITHTCHGKSGTKCSGDNTCGE